jgi:hypothetical protein
LRFFFCLALLPAEGIDRMPRFTTEFLSIPARAVRRWGTRSGHASHLIPLEILSSLSGAFAVSADTRRLIGDLLPEQDRRAA